MPVRRRLASVVNAPLAERSSSRAEHRVRLELHQPLGIDEAYDLDDRVGGADRAEHLTVDARDRVPVVDPGEQRAGADDIGQGAASLLERRGDDLEAAPWLRRRVAGADRSAVTQRGGAGDAHPAADPYRAGHADPGLERAAGRNELTARVHGDLLSACGTVPRHEAAVRERPEANLM